MDNTAKIFVTGHRGMVGSALLRRLQSGGYTTLSPSTVDASKPDGTLIAEHFNEPQALLPILVKAAALLLTWSASSLNFEPDINEFNAEVKPVCDAMGV